jgi:hypothetical protein
MQRGSQMAGKRPRQVSPLRTAMKGPRWQIETPAETSQHQAEEKITVTINAYLLKCSVCSGPLMPPLFQVWSVESISHVECSNMALHFFQKFFIYLE